MNAIEHEARYLDDDEAVRMVAAARASALRAASASLNRLAASLPGPVVSMSLRAWPLDHRIALAATIVAG